MKYCFGIGDHEHNHNKIVGSKGKNLAILKKAGFLIPHGFCLSSHAYNDFCTQYSIHEFISYELNKKSLSNIRWEELWDSGLRIRHAILKNKMPKSIQHEIVENIQSYHLSYPIVVRSSSPSEDCPAASFAGLFSSYTHCYTIDEILQSIKKVWASLWSDESLMYRKELELDPACSTMAVLIQSKLNSKFSGISFSADPMTDDKETIIVEITQGDCEGLMSGKNTSHTIRIKKKNRIHTEKINMPLINNTMSKELIETTLEIENHMGYPVDIEWAFTDSGLTILQARPISKFKETDPTRSWYLSLKPKQKQMESLYVEVNESLIPKLKKIIASFKRENIELLDDYQLSTLIEHRVDALRTWRNIYKKKFIPFAHGVRQFACYYNEHINAQDPYGFIALLDQEKRVASSRLSLILEIKRTLERDDKLFNFLIQWREKSSLSESVKKHFGESHPFIMQYKKLSEDYLDISYNNQRYADIDNINLKVLLQYVKYTHEKNNKRPRSDIEKEFFKKIPTEELAHAKHLLNIARVSWVLRDDDNLLMSALESQLLKSMNYALTRLVTMGLFNEEIILIEDHSVALCQSLRNKTALIIERKETTPEEDFNKDKKIRPLQLRGQAASPGIATGKVCIIDSPKDFLLFEYGDVLVCDTIDPVMTHLVPLACALVERRGGMLIHSTIIAREMGLPCVNGVTDITTLVKNGDILTIDGSLGVISFIQS